MDDETRIVRLVGDSRRGDMSGGGLALPDAWGAVLEQLLDTGPSTLGELVDRAEQSRALRMNERRIIAIFGSWDAFLGAVTDQLAAKEIIYQSQGLWALGPKFRTDISLTVISSDEITAVTGDPSPAPSTVTVFDAKTRRQRELTDRALTSVRKCRAEIERAGSLDSKTKRLLDQLVSHLEGRQLSETRPAQPEDEPDVLTHCTLGDHWLPKTKDNFVVYWSRDQWYWRVSCREHLTGTATRRKKVMDAVLEMIAENDGMVPSTRSVMRRLEYKDDKVLRSDWDHLAVRGKLPARPTA